MQLPVYAAILKNLALGGVGHCREHVFWHGNGRKPIDRLWNFEDISRGG